MDHQVVRPNSHCKRGPRVICFVTQCGKVFDSESIHVCNGPDRYTEMTGKKIRSQWIRLVKAKLAPILY